MILCASDGKTIQKVSDICQIQLKPFLKSTKIQIRAIKLTETKYAILNDRNNLNNCKAKGYKIFRERTDYALTKSSIEDCQIVMNYGEMTFDDKFRYCFKHYGDEMKSEITLLAGGDSIFYTKLNECIEKDNIFKKKLDKNYLKSKKI